MTEPHDDLLAEIRESLRVDPAPGFTRGVLDRIEANRASSWHLWEIAAAAVVVIGAGVATGLLMSRPWPADDVRMTATRVGDVRGAAPMEEPRVDSDAPPAVASIQPVPARASRRAAVAPSRRQPEVLVPPDQAVLMQRLLEDVAQGRVVVPPENAALNEPITISALQAPAPIEIPLIVIEPLPTTVGS
jgi:hypothetical protein